MRKRRGTCAGGSRDEGRIIGKGNVADDAESVGKDSGLIDITEMPVDVHLFCFRAGSGMGRHKRVSHGVWINEWRENLS